MIDEMTSSRLGTIPREIIDCMVHGREPNSQEVFRVAGHIWRDIVGAKSEGALASVAGRSSLRAAQAALAGCR